MKRSTTITLVIAKAGLGASLALGLLLSPHSTAHADPFDQRSFPCQEDEVLGYAPQFGADHVGCIHIDNLAYDADAYVGGYN